MAVNNFNFIATYYDAIARLVFGNKLIAAQTKHLTHIGSGDTVLILGGGTGKLLEQFPPCQGITYVEKSSKMIKLAKRRSNKNQIEFVSIDFFYFDLNKKYDVIICPFFLDCFNAENLKMAIRKITGLLKDKGKLIVTDFEKEGTSQLMDVAMHLFFRMVSSLESTKLKEIHRNLLSEGFSVENEVFFRQKMIFSRLYRNL